MKDQKELLERHGWVVECWSPFEIRHEETGSFATQIAAWIVTGHLEEIESLGDGDVSVYDG